MEDIKSTLLRLAQSAEVARNIEAEKQRKAEVAEMQRKAMDRAKAYA